MISFIHDYFFKRTLYLRTLSLSIVFAQPKALLHSAAELDTTERAFLILKRVFIVSINTV